MRDDQAADLEEYREYLRLLGQLRPFTASVLAVLLLWLSANTSIT